MVKFASHRCSTASERNLCALWKLIQMSCLILDSIKIAYEVISIDSWSRERSEGYAIYFVPLLTGQYTESVHCYRDLGNDTWWNWLERYFIGGRRKLLIDRFHGIQRTANEPNEPLNRYGNRTQSTGRLHVKRNVIVQRNIDEIDAGDTIVRHGYANKHRLPTLSGILLTYHRAREKLESFADFIET